MKYIRNFDSLNSAKAATFYSPALAEIKQDGKSVLLAKDLGTKDALLEIPDDISTLNAAYLSPVVDEPIIIDNNNLLVSFDNQIISLWNEYGEYNVPNSSYKYCKEGMVFDMETDQVIVETPYSNRNYSLDEEIQEGLEQIVDFIGEGSLSSLITIDNPEDYGYDSETSFDNYYCCHLLNLKGYNLNIDEFLSISEDNQIKIALNLEKIGVVEGGLNLSDYAFVFGDGYQSQYSLISLSNIACDENNVALICSTPEENFISNNTTYLSIWQKFE